MGTNCASRIAIIFLYCYERDFMSHFYKSTQYEIIDLFNDSSQYLDDIFDISYIHQNLNKENTSECHCWWTKESPRAYVAKFYG